jgi:hypothetical protein
MWVRVTRIEGGSAEGFHDGMRHMQEQILPAARQLEGFKVFRACPRPIGRPA